MSSRQPNLSSVTVPLEELRKKSDAEIFLKLKVEEVLGREDIWLTVGGVNKLKYNVERPKIAWVILEYKLSFVLTIRSIRHAMINLI